METKKQRKPSLKRNKKQRFLNWLNLKYITVIMLTIILTTLARDFTDKYILQFPIEWKGFTRERFVSPIPDSLDKNHIIDPLNPEPGIKNVTPSPTPTPKKKALKIDVVRDVGASELAIDMDNLFESARQLESQKGTAPVGHHKYCESIGKWNEIGYGNRQGYCFDSMAEGKAKLLSWYQNKFESGMTLANAMCYWESGYSDKDTCKYYQDYLRIN